jgi:hypothetical protein
MSRGMRKMVASIEPRHTHHGAENVRDFFPIQISCVQGKKTCSRSLEAQKRRGSTFSFLLFLTVLPSTRTAYRYVPGGRRMRNVHFPARSWFIGWVSESQALKSPTRHAFRASGADTSKTTLFLFILAPPQREPIKNASFL